MDSDEIGFRFRSHPHVCWMPIQQVPFIGPEQTKYVVTIHDLAFKFFPKPLSLDDRLKINFFTDTAIKRANKIIAISNSTKRDILQLYPKISEEKIAVVHHGFDVERFNGRCTKEEIRKTLKKYKIVNKHQENNANTTSHKPQATSYILYVGAIQPRKNLGILIEAFNTLKKENKNKNLKLIFAGEIAWKAETTLRAIKKSSNKKDIILTGKVGFQDLAKLYQGAKVFVYPSLYEGFGIPILEAMASGTPVVTANNSSLAEVGGDA